MRLVFISDTHNTFPPIPFGEILIHCGDATFNGNKEELENFFSWFGSLPHYIKIFVPGNHDFLFETNESQALDIMHEFAPDCHYLNQSGIYVKGLQFWGSPFQRHYKNWAFQVTDDELMDKWKEIPDETNVVVTHAPPFGIGDLTNTGAGNVGCPHLLSRIREIKPIIHAFGHIHPGAGIYLQHGITFINATTVDDLYRPTNPPIVINI